MHYCLQSIINVEQYLQHITQHRSFVIVQL